MRLGAIGCAAVVLAAGCARLPAVTDGLDFDQREARLEAVDAWEMRGRLAVDTGERAFQARFSWRQEADTLTLNVRSFLGGSFEITGSPEVLTVRRGRDSRVLTDPEVELSSMFGWWLPVTSLHAWLVGLPDRVYPARPRFDAMGALARLDQRLWRLDYDEYQLSDGLLLPRRMTMSYGDLELFLTVDAWAPLSPAEDALN